MIRFKYFLAGLMILTLSQAGFSKGATNSGPITNPELAIQDIPVAKADPLGGEDGPVIAGKLPWSVICVPVIVQLQTSPYREKLEYILTVFKIMAKRSGDAGWGNATLPYYIPDDETHLLRYHNYSSSTADENIWVTNLVIDYQVRYCDFEGIVCDVVEFIEDYDDWQWFFCRNSDEAEETWDIYQEFLCEELGICEGDEEFPTYEEFKHVLAGAIDHELEELFEDFEYDVYWEDGETGIRHIAELIEDGDIYSAEDALDDLYELTRDYYEALETAFDGTAPSYFEIGEDEINEAW